MKAERELGSERRNCLTALMHSNVYLVLAISVKPSFIFLHRHMKWQYRGKIEE